MFDLWALIMLSVGPVRAYAAFRRWRLRRVEPGVEFVQLVVSDPGGKALEKPPDSGGFFYWNVLLAVARLALH